MKPAPKTPSEKAAEAWGVELPAWVEALAAEATRTSQNAAAVRVGYSAAVVSAVLSRSYKGDYAAVEARVSGALMGAVVDCPVLGEIARDHCLDQQKLGFAATSSVRARVARACRSGACPHSRIKGDAA
ncbi:transcriptional regulator [Rhodoplanes elegans]|uniref:Transcriptional regulator n=1 Tax=Rhodoplanes elegans TaxID=29408 RepID=A0A327KFB4_9BRAD|nr:transcriptional regulator [Rhodoplanes elegans]MBK5957426.1 transcriptional regulator [Rhodoplanes elegans]RAI37480.1 transcriptional regulator [Rhodoplanes elegans]